MQIKNRAGLFYIFLHPLIRIVTDVLHDVFQSEPGLWGRGDDLIGRQDESVATGVPQLEGKGVFDAHLVGPVNAAATGLIWEEKKY